MPSAVGYQPTLATEMGDLQERITSTKTGSIHVCPGRLRSRRRLDRPRAGHDVHAPGRQDGSVPFHRRSWASTRPLTRWRPSHALWIPPSWARSTTAWPSAVQELLQDYSDLQDIIAILGMDELSEEQKITSLPVRVRSSSSSPSPSTWRSSSRASPVRTSRFEDTVRSFGEILDGKCDDLPEQCFRLKGGIDDVYAAYEEMKKEEA